MSIPSERIYMCQGVPLTHDYKHTLYFTSVSEQASYFQGKVKKVFPNYTFIRDTQSLKVDATYDEARVWNYLFYQNGSGKIYYAFINRVAYVNDRVTEIFFEIDVMQTYHFNYVLKECFVEREHVDNDEYYLHTIDESLDVGEYVDSHVDNVDLGEYVVLVMSTTFLGTATSVDSTAWFNNTFTSVFIYAVQEEDASELKSELLRLDREGKSDAILSMWMYPKKLVKILGSWDTSDGDPFIRVIGIVPYTESVSLSPSFEGYVPKNKRLYSYPYSYLYVTNNTGETAIYKNELFYQGGSVIPGQAVFTITGGISPDSSVRMYPQAYRRSSGHNYEEGITLATFPSCAWNQDAYKLWLAQNQHAQTLSFVTGGLTIAGGVGSAIASRGGEGVDDIVSGVSQIFGLLAQRADKAIQPPNSKGSYSTSINVMNNMHTFTICKKTVDREHAEIIDNYLTRYGYACRKIKVPNRNVRTRFTYVKTIECQVDSNLGNDISRKIESIFDNGVTFWNDHNNVGDYKTDNYIIPNESTGGE